MDDASQTTRSAPPVTEAIQPGRLVGIVVRDNTRSRGFVFVKDGTGQEYFAHKTGFQSEQLFDTIARYTGVSFRVVMTSKGRRAFDVRELETEEERAELAAQEEDRGNRIKDGNR